MTRAAILLALALGAQTPEAERFLVPIHLFFPTPGAFGSLWVSEVSILNAGATDAVIENVGPCRMLCVPEVIPPGATVTGERVQGLGGLEIPGIFLFVRAEYADRFVFQARVRDVSRAGQSAGVWLPVVHESQAVHGTLHLLDVPLDPRFRQLLRVYSFDVAPGRSVRVRIHASDHHEDLTLPLHYANDRRPLYAQLDLGTVLSSSDGGRVRLAIDPLGDFGVWGMVSVTNNDTHEVTVVLPNPRP